MEKFDLYDMNRNKTGLIINRGDKVPEGYYRLVVHVCIFNSEGKMLIQKRSANKKNWPNLWDISVGGCVSAFESSREAITREVKEEIGIDIDFSNIRPAMSFAFGEGFDDLYMVNMDIKLEDIKLQAEEVSEVKYASLEDIKELAKKNEFIKYQEHYLDFLFEINGYEDIFKE